MPKKDRERTSKREKKSEVKSEVKQELIIERIEQRWQPEDDLKVSQWKIILGVKRRTLFINPCEISGELVFFCHIAQGWQGEAQLKAQNIFLIQTFSSCFSFASLSNLKTFK